jgi:hypothetical protein
MYHEERRGKSCSMLQFKKRKAKQKKIESLAKEGKLGK